jgi:hydrogenase nickel incorporation protein HypA/HybF
VHELSIVISIIEIVEEEVKKTGLTKVEKIVLEIGSLAGIEEAALHFAWKEAIGNTVLEKSELVKVNIPGKAICLNCKEEFGLTYLYDLCPCCSDLRKEIIQGKEIIIKSLIIS